MKIIKALLIVSIIFFTSVQVNAQKLEVGITSNLHQMALSRIGGESNSFGYSIGFTGNYQLKGPWRLHSSLIFSRKSNDLNYINPLTFEGTEYTSYFNYIELPMYLSYEFDISKRMKFYPFAGLVHSIYKVTSKGIEESLVGTESSLWTYALDARIGAGISYQLSPTLKIRGEYGMNRNITSTVHSSSPVAPLLPSMKGIQQSVNLSLTFNPLKK